jgi:hypothetical protein
VRKKIPSVALPVAKLASAVNESTGRSGEACAAGRLMGVERDRLSDATRRARRNAARAFMARLERRTATP